METAYLIKSAQSDFTHHTTTHCLTTNVCHSYIITTTTTAAATSTAAAAFALMPRRHGGWTTKSKLMHRVVLSPGVKLRQTRDHNAEPPIIATAMASTVASPSDSSVGSSPAAVAATGGGGGGSGGGVVVAVDSNALGGESATVGKATWPAPLNDATRFKVHVVADSKDEALGHFVTLVHEFHEYV